MPTLLQVDEEMCLLRMGQTLPTSVRGNQSLSFEPPVLAAPVSGKPFLIYIRAMDHSLGALLAQNDDAGYEQGIYYLSRTLQGAEQRYPMIEKECLALVFAIQKMRHYLVSQTIHVISRLNPI